MESEGKAQCSNASDYKERAEEAKQALAIKEEEMVAIKAELAEKTAELNETRAVEIEMRNKLEENQKVQAENQKRLKYWGEKLGKLTLQQLK